MKEDDGLNMALIITAQISRETRAVLNKILNTENLDVLLGASSAEEFQFMVTALNTKCDEYPTSKYVEQLKTLNNALHYMEEWSRDKEIESKEPVFGKIKSIIANLTAAMFKAMEKDYKEQEKYYYKAVHITNEMLGYKLPPLKNSYVQKEKRAENKQ